MQFFLNKSYYFECCGRMKYSLWRLWSEVEWKFAHVMSVTLIFAFGLARSCASP